MCGIIGHIHRQRALDRAEFNRLRDLLYHRGPDGGGSRFLQNDQVALGHRRLSIIDLSENGRQPMTNEDGTLWLTFNGEIYNYRNLREQLIRCGHRFHSDSDSEVLLHGYEEWGMTELLSRLHGMFAFGIWDDQKQELILARDRFGIKPLVYYQDETRILFASEIKCISEARDISLKIDEDALADYFIYSYVPHPHTIWQKTRKLPPAHYLLWRKSEDKAELRRYWDLPTGRETMPEAEAVRRTDELLRTAVRDHLVSDVPVGLFLSGGYDSTALLMYAKDEQNCPATYSLGFADSDRSEHQQAADIARLFGSEHRERVMTGKAPVLPLLEKLTEVYDEPFAVSSMIPYYQISALAAQHQKVVLAGDGGDEAFGGYSWHRADADYARQPAWKRWLRHAVRGYDRVTAERYYAFMTGVMRELKQSPVLSDALQKNIAARGLWYYREAIGTTEPVKSFQYLDYRTFLLDCCLTRADLSSMAHSLEVRVPFLDHRIFEFTFGLQKEVYFDREIKKKLLYHNLKKRVDKIILDAPKRGFSYQHLDKMTGKAYASLLRGGQLVRRGYLRPGFDLSKSGARVSFHLIMLEMWFRRYSPAA